MKVYDRFISIYASYDIKKGMSILYKKTFHLPLLAWILSMF